MKLPMLLSILCDDDKGYSVTRLRSRGSNGFNAGSWATSVLPRSPIACCKVSPVARIVRDAFGGTRDPGASANNVRASVMVEKVHVKSSHLRTRSDHGVPIYSPLNKSRKYYKTISHSCSIDVARQPPILLRQPSISGFTNMLSANVDVEQRPLAIAVAARVLCRVTRIEWLG